MFMKNALDREPKMSRKEQKQFNKELEAEREQQENLNNYLEEKGIIDLNLDEQEMIILSKLAKSNLGSELEQLGASLTGNTELRVLHEISKSLAITQQQNWLILRQLMKLNKNT